MSEKLILASASPRRLELLRQIDIEPELCPVDAEEIKIGEPQEVVLHNALAKLHAAAELHPGRTVLAADTVVAYAGKILGKPKDEADAKTMLKMLSGHKHQVFTGLAVLENGVEKSLAVASDVEFFELTDAEIDAYVACGEPLDKAGAYGIQGRGAMLVKGISGDYNNIVGLPLASLRDMLSLNLYR